MRDLAVACGQSRPVVSGMTRWAGHPFEPGSNDPMMADPKPPPATGSVDDMREIAAEQLALVSFHATLAVDQFAVLADAGAFYNARRATAHMRHAVGTMKLLGEALQRSWDEARERREDQGMTGRERRGETA